MINSVLALAATVLYLLFLFVIARYADRQRKLGRSIVSNPYVYVLSLCIYATAWAFYGSVGRAASTGLGFLPIYLGPSLVMLVSWILIRKMILISQEYRLTTISDFISFRYGRSYAIGALVTISSLIVITPYVALQLIAICKSLIIISGPCFYDVLGIRRLLVAIIMGIFAIIFGTRHLDPLERHEGLISVVAFGSVVKLVAFIAAGLYISYGIFEGYGSIVEGITSNPDYSSLLVPDYVSLLSLTLMSSFAILFLPRQFHVTVVENSEVTHLKKAMWLFPLYMLLINLFVPAVAWGGLLLGAPGSADMFIVSIPISQGQDLLAFLVFIGGVSAATTMVLISSVTVGTMMLNDLEMSHLIRRIGKGRDLPSLILTMKRLNILLVVALGYLYSLLVEYHNLVDIGLLSFLAACQLAPAALGGLYWKKGSRYGAIAGLVSGFVIWGYTALVPTLIGSEGSSCGLLSNGLFGMAFLRPTSLFGLDLDLWSHALFWSMLFNCAFYVFFSLIRKPNPEEVALAESFVDFYKERPKLMLGERRMIRIGTVDELEVTVARYVGSKKAKRSVEANLKKLNTTRKDIDARQLLELRDRLERTLTGSVGSSATRMIVEKEVEITPVPEVIKGTKSIYRLYSGKIYAIPEKAYEVFTDQITHGVDGLCITFSDPEEIRKRWQFTETPIIRLSQERGRGERYISPTNLPLLFITIKSFVESSKNSIVLLDNLEELIKENVSVVPESEVLDFIYTLEDLSCKNCTKLVLKVSPEFIHKKLLSDINEIHQLIFLLGPLSSYLFKSFANAMLAGLDETSRIKVIRSIEDLRATDKLFAGVKCVGRAAQLDSSSDDKSISWISEQFVDVEPNHKLSRWEFIIAIRRLARMIQKVDPDFDLKKTTKMLLAKYGLKPYELSLIPGTTYVVEEEKPLKSLEVFSELVSLGTEGLCISRFHPEKLIENYNLSPDKVIWLTQSGSQDLKYKYVDPTNFPRLSSMISEFLDSMDEPLILLEGLGYLITQSNYESVLRFIQSLRDEIAQREAIMMIHIDPLSLDTKELHRMEGEMEFLDI
ncbi:MAG: DUF835 domain-containing protein [Methanotrichaceae archaeon]